MNFLTIQDEMVAAISADAGLAPLASTTVQADVGLSKRFIENALNTSGYAITVWPPLSGEANSDEDAHQAAEITMLVRLAINPQLIRTVKAANTASPNTNPTVGKYVSTLVADIIRSVLNIAPSPTGVRFALAPNAFEMVTFDEGLLAFHIRFMRKTVFGI